jgi:hypothetical protein
MTEEQTKRYVTCWRCHRFRHQDNMFRHLAAWIPGGFGPWECLAKASCKQTAKAWRKGQRESGKDG